MTVSRSVEPPCGAQGVHCRFGAAGIGQPAVDLLGAETEPPVCVPGPHLLVVVGCEVDDHEASSGPDQARDVGERSVGVIEVVEHLVHDDEVTAVDPGRGVVQVTVVQLGVVDAGPGRGWRARPTASSGSRRVR
jgi:hypothetical protein